MPVVRPAFDYGLLDAKISTYVQAAAHRIREKVKRSMQDIIEIGRDLLDVKDRLGFGHFGHWVSQEFGWSDRTARHFMEVAEVFGSKSEIISELAIAPTAAYLLAAPSAPYEARQLAFDRAKAGETITAAIAKEIIGATRKQEIRKGRISISYKITERLERMLERFRERWHPKKLHELAQQLRGFADTLDKATLNGKSDRRS